jgi:hypothetical protein
MSNDKSTKEQLIIELAKLRNKVYKLEDENYEKRKLEKKISDLQVKLEQNKREQIKLSATIKDILLIDMDEINEILNEYEETNNKSLLIKAADKISMSVNKVKETNGSKPA